LPLVVKAESGSRRAERSARRLGAGFIRALAVLQLFVTLPVLMILVLLYNHLDAHGFIGRSGIATAADEFVASLANYRFPLTRIFGVNGDFPLIRLDIAQRDYRRLEYAAEHDLALGRVDDVGVSIRRDTDVPAQLDLDGERVRVKLRLKGDRRIHFEDPARWSFRVEVRGAHTVMGMKRFSLHKPVARSYIYEWLFHRMLRHEGLAALRYRFVTLQVNGRSQGVYAIEQHFDKRLLEANQRREGPILRFDEDTPMDIAADRWLSMPVGVYESGRWMEQDPSMVAQATGLLEGFRAGRLTADEVFDVELLGRFFAVCDLLEMVHGTLAKSVRFYFNPITAKLEPIGYDGHYFDNYYPVLVAELSDFRGWFGFGSESSWYAALFDRPVAGNRALMESYVGALERLSSPAYLDSFFAEIEDELQTNLDFLYTEIPFVGFYTGHPRTGVKALFYFSRDKMYRRQKMIRARLRPQAAVNAYLEAGAPDDTLRIGLGNAQKLPVEIVEAVVGDRVYRPAGRLLLDGKGREDHVTYRTVDLVRVGPPVVLAEDAAVAPARLDGKRPQQAMIRYRVPGASATVEREVFSWSPSVRPAPDPRTYNPQAPLPARPFLAMDDDGHTIRIAPGRWTVERDLVIPAGHVLAGGPGTVLDLVHGARVVSYSPVHLVGGELDPFVVSTSDGSGQGLLVIDANRASHLRHVKFEGLALAADGAWRLTSVVTFHRSDVVIEETAFHNAKAEDALNIVRSSFTLRQVRFEGSASDAFDADFSDGSIEGAVFAGIGNDAIDVSGARVMVRAVRIEGAGDKGISVGEGSRLEAHGVSITGARIGVAVKDRSSFEASYLTVSEAEVGLAVFQKKPEFGPAMASLWRSDLDGAGDVYWLEQGSTMIYDGAPVEANRTSLRDAIY